MTKEACNFMDGVPKHWACGNQIVAQWLNEKKII